jgi:two-component system phosphate regulon response regulator PhoB
MIRHSVLIVEDEADIRDLISYNLLREGFQVTSVACGEAAIAAAAAKPPDLILLDLMLPGIDGLTVCQRLKTQPETKDIPVIMLTARGEEGDVVRGFNTGADDYITKPFSPRVLSARINAVLRRSSGATSGPVGDDPFTIHELTIHRGRHEVLVGEQPVELSATEFRLLCLLAQKPGWVFTREQILDGVHGGNYAITARAVDVQMHGLRKRLGSAGKYIQTVRGVGYRFRE